MLSKKVRTRSWHVDPRLDFNLKLIGFNMGWNLASFVTYGVRQRVPRRLAFPANERIVFNQLGIHC